ncbi:MAG: OmpH family outer membrane protein [Magnetococcales bacterium]|nr:OmpH family outer membrane protein [Magnetococcales bacterium]
MLKRLSSILLLALAIPLATPCRTASAADVPKFASVNVQKVLAESKASKQALEMLQRNTANKQQQLTARETEIKQLINEFKKKESVMSLEARNEAQENIQNKQREYRRLAEDHQAALDQENAHWTKKITRALQSVIRELGREQGYTAVFGKGQVIYASPETDITPQVLERLDARTKDWF